MNNPVVLASAVLALAAAGCASDAEVADGQKGPRACFFANEVAGWNDAGPARLNMRTRDGEIYQAQIYGSCPNIDFSQRLALATRFSRRVCEGDDATIIVPRGISGPERCRIDRIRRLTPEEVSAMDPKDRP